MSPKEIVTQFYTLNLVLDDGVLSHFHEEFEMVWDSSKGTLKFNKSELASLITELKRSYHSYTTQVHQILAEDQKVTTRFTAYITSIEQPEQEDALANFISIIEVKDSKIYKCFQISNLADNN